MPGGSLPEQVFVRGLGLGTDVLRGPEICLGFFRYLFVRGSGESGDGSGFSIRSVFDFDLQ